MARQKTPAQFEATAIFLVVVTSRGIEELYDASQFKPHDNNDGTLDILQEGRSGKAARYGISGWLKYTWLLVCPSEVYSKRVDIGLP